MDAQQRFEQEFEAEMRAEIIGQVPILCPITFRDTPASQIKETEPDGIVNKLPQNRQTQSWPEPIGHRPHQTTANLRPEFKLCAFEQRKLFDAMRKLDPDSHARLVVQMQEMRDLLSS